MRAEAGCLRGRRRAAAVWLVALAAACSTASQTLSTELVPPGTTRLAALDNGTTVTVLRPVDTGVRQVVLEAELPLKPAVPSRTVDASGPVGQADLWLDAEAPPVGLQYRLELGDRPGPLWTALFARTDGSPISATLYRVLDQCVRPDLLEAWKAAGGLGVLLPDFGYSAWTRKQAEDDLANCTWKRFRAEAEGLEYDEGRYFGTRVEAVEWVVQLCRDAMRSVTLPSDATGMGFVDSGRLGIEFAPWLDPMDEVSVLSKTVAVRDGVLRGLVRNWSRYLWAYEVTVTTGGREFVWPLSIQPGEVAPFEIHGWDGPAEPEQVEIVIVADMSWHADPSRAFGDLASSYVHGGPFAGFGMGADLRARFPAVTADITAGAESVGRVMLRPLRVAPNSHPSLAGGIDTLPVADLRMYGAVFDGDGRLVDVSPVSLRGRLWGVVPTEDRLVDVAMLPLPEGMESRLFADMDVFVDLTQLEFDYEQRSPLGIRGDKYDAATGEFRSRVEFNGGFIFWIGAAHPKLDADA